MRIRKKVLAIVLLIFLALLLLGVCFQYQYLDHQFFQQLKELQFKKIHEEAVSISSQPSMNFVEPEEKSPRIFTVAKIKIEKKLQTLNFTSMRNKEAYTEKLNQLIAEVRDKEKLLITPWELAKKWVKPYEIHPVNAPELGSVLSAMESYPFEHSDVSLKGTQLKLTLTLEGGQKVFFKPMRFLREYIINGVPYAGADRHNGEIAAFHLSRLLSLCRTPLVVGRKVNLKTEILPVAAKALMETFIIKDNQTCFYGKCFHCKPSEPVCGDDVIEGAVILLFPEYMKLKRYPSPWQRTYKENVTARWEVDSNYCSRILKKPLYKLEGLLLDLIDAAIFDFLIGNADRHHFEIFNDFKDSKVILLDNGKSFGNPYWDELTILAPLYQCCRVRKTTYGNITLVAEGLGEAMEELLLLDPLSPILTQPHLDAFDRRLRTVISAIEVCFDEKGMENVLF